MDYIDSNADIGFNGRTGLANSPEPNQSIEDTIFDQEEQFMKDKVAEAEDVRGLPKTDFNHENNHFSSQDFDIGDQNSDDFNGQESHDDIEKRTFKVDNNGPAIDTQNSAELKFQENDHDIEESNFHDNENDLDTYAQNSDDVDIRSIDHDIMKGKFHDNENNLDVDAQNSADLNTQSCDHDIKKSKFHDNENDLDINAQNSANLDTQSSDHDIEKSSFHDNKGGDLDNTDDTHTDLNVRGILRNSEQRNANERSIVGEQCSSDDLPDVMSYDLEVYRNKMIQKEQENYRKEKFESEQQKTASKDVDICTLSDENLVNANSLHKKKKKRSKRNRSKSRERKGPFENGANDHLNTHLTVLTAPGSQSGSHNTTDLNHHLNSNRLDPHVNHAYQSESDGYHSPNEHSVYKMSPSHFLPSLNRNSVSTKSGPLFGVYETLPKIGVLCDNNGNDDLQGHGSRDADVEKDEERKHGHVDEDEGEVPDGVVWTSEAYDAIEKRLKAKPSFFCRTLATRPVASFLFFLFFHVSFIAVTIGLFFGGYSIYPVDFEATPVYLTDDPSYQRSEAFNKRDDHLNIERRYAVDFYSIFPNWWRGREDERMELFFEALDDSGNMFTQRNLKLLEKIEKHLFELEKFQSYYCQLSAYNECIKPESVLRFFDGTYKHVDQVFSDPDFDNIAQVFFMAEYYNETRDEVQKYLGKTAVITQSNARSPITRSFQIFGYPTRNPAGVKPTDTYLYDEFKPEIVALQKKYQGIGFYYYLNSIYKQDTSKQAFLDFALAGGSLLFIVAFMLYHTRSAWITFWSVFSIVTSFLITNMVYRIVFGYIYFGFFHVASVFIILGIGVDDVFVYYDIWRSTDFYRYPTFAHRVSDCYHRAAKVMFATSLTTMMAFFVSAFSPLFMVKTFGLFTGLLVLMNYLSVITFIPTVVIIYHLKFEQNCCLCCSCGVSKVAPEPIIIKNGEPGPSAQTAYPGKVENKQQSSLNETSKTGRNHSGDTDLKAKNSAASLKEVLKQQLECLCTVCGHHCHKQTTSATDYRQHTTPREHKRKNILIRFFRGPYYKFITHKVARWIILTLFLGLVITSVYFCTKIQPDEEPFKLYRPNTNYGKATKFRIYGFRPTDFDRYIYMYFVWGIKEYDFSMCNLKDIWDIEYCRGTTVFDDDFDMNRPSVQETMMDFCQDLSNMPQDDIDAMKVEVDKVTGKPQVECFMTDLHKFLMKEKENDYYPDDLDLSYPLNESKMKRFMSYHPHIYNISALSPEFNSWFEIAVNYWLSDGYRMYLTRDFLVYNWKLTEVKTQHTVKIPNFYQTYGNKLKYANVRVNLTLNSKTQNYVEGLPIIDKWENYLAEWSKKLPAHANKPFIVTPGITNVYHWMRVQAALSYQALLGLVIGISLAFPVLVLATQNIIVGTLATLSIAFTTLSVCAIIPLVGWKLGVMESLNLCLVVSLAVDYVVHLAEGYFYTPFDDRKGRTYKMLEDVAISVFSGAATTLGASLFLLFTVILFYLQFGVFLFCTIGFSIVYALGFFALLMPLIGPQNEFGSLRPLWSLLGKKLHCPAHKK